MPTTHKPQRQIPERIDLQGLLDELTSTLNPLALRAAEALRMQHDENLALRLQIRLHSETIRMLQRLNRI